MVHARKIAGERLTERNGFVTLCNGFVTFCLRGDVREGNRRSMAHPGGERQEEKVWRYQAVNTYTGEVVELRGDGAGRWRGVEAQHVRLFQQAIRRLGQEGRIGKESWRVLAYLLGILEWDNWLVVPQVQIAEALGMHRVQVSRAIRQLLAEGILGQAEPPAPKTAYRFRAEFAYRGSMNGWQKRRREEGVRQRARGEAQQEDTA